MDCQNERQFFMCLCAIDRLHQRHLSCYEIRRWDDRTSVSISELSLDFWYIEKKSRLVSHIHRVGPSHGTTQRENVRSRHYAILITVGNVSNGHYK